MPSDAVLKVMNTVHRTVLKASGGRLGWDAAKMPVIQLTTTGRKSGQKRTVLLTSPVTHDGAMVLVASKGGSDSHPDWFFNLQADSAVTVTTRDGSKPMTARVATADERSELWPKVADGYERYADYQEKTDREIPLVLLSE